MCPTMEKERDKHCSGSDSDSSRRGQGRPTPVGRRFIDLCAEYRRDHREEVGVPLEIQDRFFEQAKEEMSEASQSN